MDIVPDKKAGRKTTAIVLGIQKTKILIIFIVAIEVFLLMYVYGDYINIYHNTFYIDGNSTSSRSCLFLSSADNCKIKNNIFIGAH